jgi:hypothetical protein
MRSCSKKSKERRDTNLFLHECCARHTNLRCVLAENSHPHMRCTRSIALGPDKSSCIAFFLQIHARHAEEKINACALF